MWSAGDGAGGDEGEGGETDRGVPGEVRPGQRVVQGSSGMYVHVYSIICVVGGGGIHLHIIGLRKNMLACILCAQ